MFHFVIAFSLVIFSYSNTENKDFDFSDVDHFARNIDKGSDYKQTADILTAPFDSEIEKARSIYIWITHNLEYDIGKFKKQITNPMRERIVANSKEELEAIKESRRVQTANLAFKKGKGVCEDYAYLFNYMCEHVGLEAVFIPGYGRFSAQEINRDHRGSNHAWNAIKIDDKWYLLDATWAAGSTNMVEEKFIKDFKEGLFMAPPERFILSHFPDDPAWQLLKRPLNKEDFKQLPYGFPSLSDNNIIDYFPNSGVIHKRNGTIKIGLKLKDPNRHFVLVENRQLSKLKPEIKEDEIVFSIDPNNLRSGELTIALVQDQKLNPIISYIVK